MAKQIHLTPVRTYKTEANAVKAVEDKYFGNDDNLRYVVMQNDEGRFFPVFIGERAINAGVHFHFCVVN